MSNVVVVTVRVVVWRGALEHQDAAPLSPVKQDKGTNAGALHASCWATAGKTNEKTATAGRTNEASMLTLEK